MEWWTSTTFPATVLVPRRLRRRPRKRPRKLQRSVLVRNQRRSLLLRSLLQFQSQRREESLLVEPRSVGLRSTANRMGLDQVFRTGRHLVNVLILVDQKMMFTCVCRAEKVWLGCKLLTRLLQTVDAFAANDRKPSEYDS